MKQVTEMTINELKAEIDNYTSMESEGMGTWSQKDTYRHEDILREYAKQLHTEDAETYSVKVDRPDGLSDSQWEAFCELMDGEDFEGADFWGTVDSLFQAVLEGK